MNEMSFVRSLKTPATASPPGASTNPSPKARAASPPSAPETAPADDPAPPLPRRDAVVPRAKSPETPREAETGDTVEVQVPVSRGPSSDPRESPGDAPDVPVAAERDDGANARAARRTRLIVAGAILIAILAVGSYGYWDHARRFESTDDAFIQARQSAIAPKVSGFVTQVPVTDNQHVAAGDVIARIDDRDFRVALAQAQAQVAAAEANIRNIEAQIGVQDAQVGANQAQVEQAQAALTFAQQQADRYRDLAARSAGTVQMAEQTISTLHQDQAALQSAQAALTVAQRQIKSLEAQRSSATASLAQAQAQRDQAQLNLSYTIVTAAQAGRVVALSAAVGQLAQAGTNLAMFVPDEIWVVANFKETQLADMRPDQPATMSIDAYPDRVFRGTIASVQPGSGTAFSLLPAENATGNYVKVVQRVPVKIRLDDPPTDVSVGPGMSVEPTVRVLAAPSLYERLRRSL